jgi:chemotaxis protein MotB
VRRRRRVEEHVNHERWLVSYADFVTLLFALFVVLFASSRHDQKTIRKVSQAVKNGFQELGIYSATTSPTELSPADLQRMGQIGLSDTKPTIDTRELEARLHKALGREIEQQQVVLKSTPDGFVISLHELGFFDSGQATLLPGASETIKRIAGVLMQFGLDMRVEGHSDNIPIHNAAFNSNWDLSTARATAVAMMLLKESNFDPQRMSIAGYAEYHPATSNDTPEGRRTNRRVDLVVVSTGGPLTPPR